MLHCNTPSHATGLERQLGAAVAAAAKEEEPGVEGKGSDAAQEK